MSEYDTDILRWSEHQAELLRRRAANELDWQNIAEEIEDVGSEQLHAAESLLTNIMQHLLQIAAWPGAAAVPHWRHEVIGWRTQLRRRLRRSPSLRARLDLPDLYRDACAVTYPEVDGVPRPALPPECPWTLAELEAEPEAA